MRQRTHSCLLRKMLKLLTLTFPLLEILRIVLLSHMWISCQREELISVIQKRKLTFCYVLSLNIYADFCTVQVVTLYTSPQHLNTVFLTAFIVSSFQSCLVSHGSTLFYISHLDSPVNISWKLVSITKYAVWVKTYLYVIRAVTSSICYMLLFIYLYLYVYLYI